MKVIKIFEGGNPNLEVHRDLRGVIADVFYDANINHVAVVRSEPYSERGNHYHKESTQHMLMTKGVMEYWFKNLYSLEPSRMIIVPAGYLITTPPFEIHALRYLSEPSEFVVFTEGPRGGKDYEADTVRTTSIFDYQ